MSVLRKKVNGSSVKKSNQSLILHTVFDNGVISRSEIAKILSMSKPTVNEHIDILIQEGIINVIGVGSVAKKGGRRPILLEPNCRYKVNIALDLNYTKPIIALGTITGSPIDKLSLEAAEGFEEDNMFHAFIVLIKNSVKELLMQNNISREDIGVAIISTPGIVNEEIDEVNLPEHSRMNYISTLKKMLEECYSIEVLIKSDVDMALVGEAKFLKSDNLKDLLFVSCGRELGASVVINGDLYEGSQNAAGEIGYFIDSPDGITLNEKISVRSFLKNLRARAKETEDTMLNDFSDIKFDTAVYAYNRKDKIVIEEIEKIGDMIGVAINNAVALYDVSTVIIGGDYVIFQDILIPRIKRIIQNSKIPIKPDIIPTTLYYAGGVIGCFEIAKNHIIESL